MDNSAVILFILLQLVSICVAMPITNLNHHTFLDCMSTYSQRESGIRERIYTPNSPSYISLLEFAEKNPRWYNLTTQRPFAIVTPREVNEIRLAIQCGKELGIQLRVKSGGHDYEGLSFRSEMSFVMIDISNLNSTMFDLKNETVWIQAGVTLGQLYYEIAQKSTTLAFPGGLYSSIGSGGHISGGGLGTMMRKHGLAADNVLDAVIMDVNGRVLDRKGMGEDLFWAIRGGGGASFGVILAWKLKLVRVPEQVTAFTVRRKLDPDNLELFQKWQNNAFKLQDDLFIRVLISNNYGSNPGDEKIVQVSYNGLFLGTADKLALLLSEKFPEFDLEAKDCFQEPPVNLNCSDRPCKKKDCYQVPWIRSVLYFTSTKPDRPLEVLLNKVKNQKNFEKATSDFLKTPISNAGWKMIIEMLLSEDQPLLVIDPLGGKIDEIGEDETPFPHRKGNLFNIQYMTKWSGANSKGEAGKHLKWIREIYKKMEPYVAKSPRTAYLNYKDLEFGKNDMNYSFQGAKVWGEKYFKENFERLARVKGKVLV